MWCPVSLGLSMTDAVMTTVVDEELAELGSYLPRAEGVETLDASVLDEFRAEARQSLFFFAKGVLGYKDLDPDIHGPICRLLEDQSKTRLLFTLPRGWFKSSLISIAFPIWLALQDCNLRILIAQNTVSNAIKKLSEIDAIFKQNQLFRILFPELLPTKDQVWRTDAMCVPRTATAPEATFEAAGVKTTTVSRHYDVVIEDDTVSPDFDELGVDTISPTKEDIGLAIGWHQGMHQLLIHPVVSRNVVVGTRWFERDLQSYIAENEKSYVKYQRAALETNGLPDPLGEPTWPSRWTREVLADRKSLIGPYMFSCLFLNLPISGDQQTFKLEWFKYYETEDRDLIVTITVDPAGDPEDSKGVPDWNAIVTTGKSQSTGRIFVLEYVRGKWNYGQLLDALFIQVQKWHPIKVGVEAQAYQKILLRLCRERMQKQDVWFNIEAITNNRKSKNLRIQGLQPYIASGELAFRTHQHELVGELLSFPNGAHDDLADALAMHLPLWIMTRSVEQAEREIRNSDPFSFDSAIDDLENAYQKQKGVSNRVFDVIGGTPVNSHLTNSVF